MKRIRFVCRFGLYGLLFAAHSVASAATVTSPSEARVEVVTQTETAMTLQFFDWNGSHSIMNFSRSDSESLWKVQGLQNVSSGIIFGNSETHFASPVRQRAAGISPQQALTTMDSSILWRPMDDITIFYLGAGDLAIGLWQSGSIMEIHYVGSLVTEVLDPVFQFVNFCPRLESLCCRKFVQPSPLFGQPDVPAPNHSACQVLANNCGKKQEACDCLMYACDFCFEHPEFCCGPHLGDSGDPDCPWPWLPMGSEEACNVGGALCVDPPGDDDEDAVIDAVFEEIANRLQILVDLQNNL